MIHVARDPTPQTSGPEIPLRPAGFPPARRLTPLGRRGLGTSPGTTRQRESTVRLHRYGALLLTLLSLTRHLETARCGRTDKTPLGRKSAACDPEVRCVRLHGPSQSLYQIPRAVGAVRGCSMPLSAEAEQSPGAMSMRRTSRCVCGSLQTRCARLGDLALAASGLETFFNKLRGYANHRRSKTWRILHAWRSLPV